MNRNEQHIAVQFEDPEFYTRQDANDYIWMKVATGSASQWAVDQGYLREVPLFNVRVARGGTPVRTSRETISVEKIVSRDTLVAYAQGSTSHACYLIYTVPYRSGVQSAEVPSIGFTTKAKFFGVDEQYVFATEFAFYMPKQSTSHFMLSSLNFSVAIQNDAIGVHYDIYRDLGSLFITEKQGDNIVMRDIFRFRGNSFNAINVPEWVPQSVAVLLGHTSVHRVQQLTERLIDGVAFGTDAGVNFEQKARAFLSGT